MSTNKELTCFTVYDVRGKLGEELNEDIAYRIGRAFAKFVQSKRVVVGGDVRETSEGLKNALARGLMDEGTDVIDIGMVGTEEIYFATRHLDTCGGIEVTASHNPIDYNGMKFVKSGSVPISMDSGLDEIKKLAEQADFDEVDSSKRGTLTEQSTLRAYAEHLLTYVDVNNFKPRKLVVNSGSGAAGHVIDELEVLFSEKNVPITFVKQCHEPDSTFPYGIPNPLIVENRKITSDAVLESGADMGIAWDGDFDRCFLFDEKGAFIEGYYIVGLLAEAFLKKNPGQNIVYDTRLTWNTIDMVEAGGGTPIMSKTGHAFMKERMRKEDAVYGGEMSAHHYFRDFGYCDSGMIPWLLVTELLCQKGQPLSELVSERIAMYPSSGEINSRLKDPDAAIKRVLDKYKDEAVEVDYTDGIGVSMEKWRLNLRKSNTEPMLRLNVESRGDALLVKEKTEEVLDLIRSEA